MKFKKLYIIIGIFVLLGLLIAGCDLLDTYSVSGTVIDGEEIGVADIEIAYEDLLTDGTVTTDDDGNWSISGITGDITITPVSTEEYSFEPESKIITEEQEDITFTIVYIDEEELTGTRITGFQIEDDKLTIDKVGPDNPIIYDNDWFLDVVDSFYIYAKASLGEADLRGIIASRDMWPGSGDYTYTLQQSINDAEASIDIARNSGLENIPDPITGADQRLQKPASGRIEDTEYTITDGSEFIVEEAHNASPEEPLVILIGGPFTTVANAYLSDPSIAENVVVFGLLSFYNDKDQWAVYVVSKGMQYAGWGRDYFWWEWGDVLPLERFDDLLDLADNEMNNQMRDFMATDLGQDNQLGDGAWLTWIYENRAFNGVDRYYVTGEPMAGYSVDEGDDYDILDVRIPHNNIEAMREEFFTTMESLWE